MLSQSTPRSRVIAELGAPVWPGEKDGHRVDVFAFVQGYRRAAKAGHALFHATVDVLTLGLWEMIATPTEAAFGGTSVKVEVIYDGEYRVRSAQALERRGNADRDEGMAGRPEVGGAGPT